MPDGEQVQAAAIETEPAKEEIKESSDAGVKEEKGNPADKLTPEHPRFQEVYGKMKGFERNLADKETDIELLRQHNKKLADSLENVRQRVDKSQEGPKPDPVEQPQEYAAYMELQFDKMKKEEEARRVQDRFNIQVDTQKELHDDYESVVKIAMRDIELDKALRDKIWGSDNPARAAYKYGKDKMKESEKESGNNGKLESDSKDKEKAEKERLAAIEQGKVEGGGNPPVKSKDVKLTDEEKRVARALGVSDKDYAKQREFMEAR